ncbi:uncharacterized protein DFL_005293 [Arthrobotrys flagrans]|uniref:Secreted protein n=1 Tax=Arthrobotrys flagrans TaxID=97331 RepID=A0A437A779_ARTFL|nr:hypothetical protein DFL_005293 [Arthrobotrys flagrans]
MQLFFSSLTLAASFLARSTTSAANAVEVNRGRDFLPNPGLDLEQLVIPTKYLNPGIQQVCSSDKVCCLNNPWLYPEPLNNTGGSGDDDEYGETLERQWRYVLRPSVNRRLARRGDNDIALYSTDTSTKTCIPVTSGDHSPFTVTYTTRHPVLTAVDISILALGGDTQKNHYAYITTLEADCIYAYITKTATRTATLTKTDTSVSTRTVATAGAVTASGSACRFELTEYGLVLAILAILAISWM